MADASEIAALMASEGDYEKKISWLKRAIVSVTKQKQEVEAQNAQLQRNFLASQKESEQLKEENLKLHKRVSMLESELQQERKKTSFGHTMLKGLSSLVSTNQIGVTEGEHTGQRAGQVGESRALDLSSADVEHIIKQNEDLMIQLYDIKNDYEELRKSCQKDTEKHQAELISITHETEDLRILLEEVTNACDALNSDCSRLKAIVHFCRYFFSIASLRSTPAAITMGTSTLGNDTPHAQSAYQHKLYFQLLFPADTDSPIESLPTDIEEELVRRTIQNVCRRLSTLLSGVSVLIVALRDALPQSPRSTVASLRFSEDRLTALLEANNVVKDRLSYLIKNLEEFVLTSSDKNAATLTDSVSTLLSNQRELLQGVCSWVTMIQNHLPLLVNGCTAYLPQDHKYRVRTSALSDDVCEVSDREVFVDMVVANANAVLSWIRGCLEGMELLLWEPAEKVLSAMIAQHSEVCALPDASRTAQLKWLIAHQQVWWEGSTALPELVRASLVMVSALEDMAGACAVAQIRDVIKYIASNLDLLSSGKKGGRCLSDQKMRVCALGDSHCFKSHDVVGKGPPLPQSSQESYFDTQHADPDELLHGLAAADRAAVCYYTQMNATMIELAKKEDIIWGLQEELQEARVRLDQQEIESERMQVALQEQIGILSDQLVVFTNSAALLKPPQK
ncbi:unnamed protein product [Phytomonas sp. EM1]|nr:unnamed protein product [Phytomonas sp. EM1]|eukprot:CCW59718.1 unnamed protein product [Phytomonas sp. isolate EM1]